MGMLDKINKMLPKQHETLDKEVKRCKYCNLNVNTTNEGICSRKQCRKNRISHDGMQGQIILYEEKMIEARVL